MLFPFRIQVKAVSPFSQLEVILVSYTGVFKTFPLLYHLEGGGLCEGYLKKLKALFITGILCLFPISALGAILGCHCERKESANDA